METHEARQLAALTEGADAGLKGLDAKSWRDRLEGRLDDLQAAFDLLLGDERSVALQMATGMAGFWMLTGRIPEGRAWLDRACAAADPEDVTLPRALYENALLAFWQGDDAECRSLLARSHDVAHHFEDATGEAVALCGMARVALRDDDLDRARALCEEALVRVDGTEDRLGRSNAFHVLGVTAQMRGELDDARGYMNRRLALARELGNVSAVASEANNLSMVERQAGNLDMATELALEALEISDRRGDEWMVPYELSSLAAIAAARGDFERAAKLLGAAAGMMERMGTAWPPDEKPHFERTWSATATALGQERFERIRSDGGHMSSRDAVAFALGGS
jgi:tetratricopeptide (TPR) repeat protein